MLAGGQGGLELQFAVESGGVRWSAVRWQQMARRGGRWSAQIACNPASVPLGWLRLAEAGSMRA